MRDRREVGVQPRGGVARELDHAGAERAEEARGQRASPGGLVTALDLPLVTGRGLVSKA